MNVSALPSARSRRRFFLALALSVLAHVLLFTLTPRKPEFRPPMSSRAGPMIVDLQDVPPQPEAPPPAPTPPPRPNPPPPARRILAARPHTPRAAPPVVAQQEPTPAPPAPVPAPPAMDMLAMLNARREKRRVAEAAAAREGARTPAPVEDAGAAAIERNLQTLKGDDQTGGIFQILEKGSYDAEYAFNGWTPETHRRWREVIEVHVKPGEDIDRGIVRSMIALIRTHYTGDFLWESHRLGKVVTLSARPEDNADLEDFLIREFFGTPVLNSRRR